MRDLYTAYRRQWRDLGGGTLAMFTDVSSMSKYGAFGLLEYQDQPVATAPKYLASREFMDELRKGRRESLPGIAALSVTKGPSRAAPRSPSTDGVWPPPGR